MSFAGHSVTFKLYFPHLQHRMNFNSKIQWVQFWLTQLLRKKIRKNCADLHVVTEVWLPVAFAQDLWFKNNIGVYPQCFVRIFILCSIHTLVIIRFPELNKSSTPLKKLNCLYGQIQRLLCITWTVPKNRKQFSMILIPSFFSERPIIVKSVNNETLSFLQAPTGGSSFGILCEKGMVYSHNHWHLILCATLEIQI